MTVCIAISCEKGKSVVVVSDRMITAGFLARQFEDDKRKIHRIINSVVALTAGDATRAIEIFRTVKPRISSEPDSSVRDIAGLVCEEYEKLRSQKVDSIHFKPRGMTRESFYKEYAKQLPETLAMFLDKSVFQEELGINLIIAGVDDSGGHIFGISDPGNMECYDSIGYHSIGIGQPHVLNSLIGRKASTSDSLLTCLYNVYEAKKISESAPGVGKITDIAIIKEEGIKFLLDRDIRTLESTYEKISKPRKTNIEKELKGLSISK